MEERGDDSSETGDDHSLSDGGEEEEWEDGEWDQTGSPTTTHPTTHRRHMNRILSELVLRVWQLLPHRTSFPERGDATCIRIRAAAQEAIEVGSTAWGIQEAEGWGGPFRISQERVARDEAFVRTNGSVGLASRSRWTELDESAEGRLNPTRTTTILSHDNPNFDQTMDLAEEFGGIPVLIPPGFIANGTNHGILPTVSAQTHRVSGAMHRMVSEGYHESKLCFVLSLRAARELVPNMHLCTCQWAPKDLKLSGRFCMNCSNGGKAPTNQPLNSEWLRAAARDRWGLISHPTIELLVGMIEEFRAAAIASGMGHRRIRLWKMDLKGAYTLLTFRADDVHLMGCQLPEELVAFFTGGTFGWGAMPFAFQVITRAVDWELNVGVRHRLHGMSMMYVDDIMGVSFEEDVDDDQATVTQLVEGLLGKGAIATNKTVKDVDGVLEAIGYRLDHITNRVGISEKNVKKAFFAAYSIGNGTSVTRKMIQRVASHSSRYKRVVPIMAPFCRALHSACKGHTHPHVRFALTDAQMLSVWMMKILLILTVVDGVSFTRAFSSFTMRHEIPQWILEYDACLTGIAIIWFRIIGGLEVAVGCAAVSLASLNLKTRGSGLMNTVEFMAATLAIKGLIAQGEKDVSVVVRGDNNTAMTWATDRTFKSTTAMKTAVVHVAQTVKARIEVVEKRHLPHTSAYDYNWRCDLPSRGEATWDQVRVMDAGDKVTGTRLGPLMKEWTIPGWEEVVALCDPFSSEVADEAFVRRVMDVV
jgi:hypothetical protein